MSATSYRLWGGAGWNRETGEMFLRLKVGKRDRLEDIQLSRKEAFELIRTLASAIEVTGSARGRNMYPENPPRNFACEACKAAPGESCKPIGDEPPQTIGYHEQRYRDAGWAPEDDG